MPPEFRTERLFLRIAQTEDAPGLYDLVKRSMAELSPWFWWALGHNLATETTWCELAKPYRDADVGFEYTIFTRDKTLVGHIDAVREDRSKTSIEIGFWLGTPYCGHGYAAEALAAVTNGAIAAGFQRIFLCIDIENARCRRVAEKCGYRMEKIVTQTDRSPTGGPRERCIYTFIPKSAV